MNGSNHWIGHGHDNVFTAQLQSDQWAVVLGHPMLKHPMLATQGNGQFVQ